MAVAWSLGLLLLAGCGSDSESDSASPTSTGGAGVTSATTVPSSPASSGECPISADGLSTATSLRWELQERRENHPLETDETIRATVCLFTAPDKVDEFGDPLVFRTDVVTGADAATVRQRFGATCGELGGTTQPSGGGTECRRNGVVVEGVKGEGDRVVEAAFVNADTSTASELTPAFSRILTAIR